MPVLGRSSSSSVIPPVVKRRTAGNLTFNNTTWLDLDTGLDIDLPAKAGDWVEVEPNGLWTNAGGVFGWLDIVTVVGGSPVNSVVLRTTPTNSDIGCYTWMGTPSAYGNIAGAITYQLQSGDISGGQVKLRVRCRVSSGTNKTIQAVTGEPFHVSARNLTQSVAVDAITSVVSVTTTYTAQAGQLVKADASSGGFTVTLPSAAITGTKVTVKKTDSSASIVTVVGASSALIDGDTAAYLTSEDVSVTFVSDGLNWQVLATTSRSGSTLMPVHRLRRAAAQGIANNSNTTAVSWDTQELDTGAWTAGDPTKLTIVVSGRYEIDLSLQFASAGTGVQGYDLIKNNSTTLMSALLPSNSVGVTTQFNIVADLVAGDYLEAKPYQNTGSTRNTSTNTWIVVKRVA